MNEKKLTSFFCLIAVLLIAGCRAKYPDIKWDYSDKEVVRPKPEKTDKIDIDVYVDATTSMEGFAVGNASVYSQFLDQLEASALSAWRNANPQYYKFGENIKPISRSEYLSAKADLQFYHEPGIFKKTYIDSVVKRTDAKRLSVLVTDLFQDEGDVNIMVDRFKEKCFANNVAVGLVGVKSNFKGKVFDVRGYPAGYQLDAQDRPFYAIVFGNQYNMELLFEALKNKPFVKEEQLLIFTKHIVEDADVALTKTRESKNISNKKAKGNIKNNFDFGMKEEGTSGKVNFTITLDRNTRCADFNANNLELIAFKKSATDAKNVSKDSTATNDITLEKVERTGDKLTGVLSLNNEDGPGNYSYMVLLKTNQLSGLQTPAWIKNFSTDAPVPGTSTASKTYNLEKLASTLLVANASIAPTYVAKFYINIFKR
jgi:hypothetical protein